MAPHPRDSHTRNPTRQAAATLHRVVAQAMADADTMSAISPQERTELIAQVAQLLPAGNALAFVYSGIRAAMQRSVPGIDEDHSSTARAHLHALQRALHVLGQGALYGAAFGGPTALLSGYRMLLRLAGADPDAFLPEGVWQFYVQFALREDAARHQNATIGFQRAQAAMRRTGQTPSPAHELAAWLLAALWLLHHDDDLLGMIYDENTTLAALQRAGGSASVVRAWQTQRPFRAPAGTSLVAARHDRFAAFVADQYARLTPTQRATYDSTWASSAAQDAHGRARRAFQRQMRLARTLEPGEFSEELHPIRPERLCVGVIWRGQVFTLPYQDPTVPATAAHVLAWASALLCWQQDGLPPEAVTRALLRVPRTQQQKLRGLLAPPARAALETLRAAPVLLHWGDAHGHPADDNVPLPQVRARQRGIGDHPLTVFRAVHSTVFDFSHVFFDGPWAMSVAEMLTNEATHALDALASALPTPHDAPPVPLALTANADFAAHAMTFPAVVNRVAAEAHTSIAPLHALRQALARRTRPPLRMTINDLLVLYRVLFNQAYQPSAALLAALRALDDTPCAPQAAAVRAMLAALPTQNPALLIPIDAEHHNPRDRLYPSTFINPLPQFWREHQRVMAVQQGGWGSALARRTGRNRYLGNVVAFVRALRQFRQHALHGQSMSHTAVRLIAVLPGPLKRLANALPSAVPGVNAAIKGEEVFSNVGRVVAGSSLTRFSSAKDDNPLKVLVWGIMTDDAGQLVVTLRDFRPPVVALVEAGHEALALHVTQDFVTQYVQGVVRFTADVQHLLDAR